MARWLHRLRIMISAELTQAALTLSIEDRLELARRLVESAVQPEAVSTDLQRGIRRIEDVAGGKVVGLTEEQFQAALK